MKTYGTLKVYFKKLGVSSDIGQIQAVTVTYTDTYYIYSFDGKLLSEYDQSGSCVRDYIYAGNRVIAEYRPATVKYYYYMSDQINSTRIITDDSGAVVYSEAYGPYGDVQKTWTKTYDPRQKFSGKEREGYSELDYFGARYFDNNSYRFISVDPIINKEEALSNPQLWNLYAYCRNNPITYLDPDGKDVILLNKPNLPYGDGHNAVLIGNNKTGWRYASQDGEKYRLAGPDENSSIHFNNLEDFQKSESWQRYPRKYKIARNENQDKNMIAKARAILTDEYSIEGFNCADFTEEVMKAGQIRVKNFKVKKYGYKYTSPNLQFEYIKNHNEGSFIEKRGN